MKCVICSQDIEPDENVFWLSRMICCGYGDHEYKLLVAPQEKIEVIHTFCLESTGEAKETPNTAICEVAKEESIVQRSNALSLFDGIL